MLFDHFDEEFIAMFRKIVQEDFERAIRIGEFIEEQENEDRKKPFKKVRKELGEKYGSMMVDGVTHKMSDDDFLEYLEATFYFQVLSGESPIGKVEAVLKEAIRERSENFREKLADLLAVFRLTKLEGIGREEVAHFEKMARSGVI